MQTTPAFQWQHVDIQRGPKGHPALDKKYVREALVMGINRQQIVECPVGVDRARSVREGSAGAPEQRVLPTAGGSTSRTGTSTSSARGP